MLLEHFDRSIQFTLRGRFHSMPVSYESNNNGNFELKLLNKHIKNTILCVQNCIQTIVLEINQADYSNS